MRRIFLWILALAAGGVGVTLGACKREPLKAGPGTNAPALARPVLIAGPTGQDLEKENRAKLIEKLYVLEPLGEGTNFKAPDGEQWARYANGLMIHELRPSSDGQPPRLGQTVSVAYVGTFPGTTRIFDQKSASDPLTFKMGSKDLIKGFSLALQGMHPGGKRRVYVPGDLAYGAAGNLSADIGFNQPLIFEIELLSVTGPAIEITAADLPKFAPLGPPAPTTTPLDRPATRP